MKEATGEMNMTVVTIIAIGAVIAFFWFMWNNVIKGSVQSQWNSTVTNGNGAPNPAPENNGG